MPLTVLGAPPAASAAVSPWPIPRGFTAAEDRQHTSIYAPRPGPAHLPAGLGREYAAGLPRKLGRPAPRRRSAWAGPGRFAAGAAGAASDCSSLRRGLRRTPRRWGPINRVLCCVRQRSTAAGPPRSTSARNIRAVIRPPGPCRVRPGPAAAGRRLRPRLRLPQPDAAPARPGGEGPAPLGLHPPPLPGLRPPPLPGLKTPREYAGRPLEPEYRLRAGGRSTAPVGSRRAPFNAPGVRGVPLQKNL